MFWEMSHFEFDPLITEDPEMGVSILRALLSQMSRRIHLMNENLATAGSKSSPHEFWGAEKS